jgi:tetratricopeptide (TPR) repeat protein
LRALLSRATSQNAYATAAATAGDLANLLRLTGRWREALAVVDDMEGFARRGGIGPWTQLGVRGQRLQLLRRMGDYEQVLAEVDRLREKMAALPEAGDQEESAPPWNVRETILQTGVLAAQGLGRWQLALDLNSEVVRSQAGREASELEQARSRFNDYGPLLHLGRQQEARDLLLSCRAVYQAEGAVAQLSAVFSAQAALEYTLGRNEDAAQLEQTALRYAYATQDVEGIAASHGNLAEYLRRSGGDPAAVVAHRLAAAVTFYQISSAELPAGLRRLAGELAEFGEQVLPRSFEELAGWVGQVEGVRLSELLAGLPGRTGEEALAEVLRSARDQPASTAVPEREILDQWMPIIDRVVAAAGGNTESIEELAPALDLLEKTRDWSALIEVLRRILAGERSQNLLRGLNEVDTQIVAEVLRRLSHG